MTSFDTSARSLIDWVSRLVRHRTVPDLMYRWYIFVAMAFYIVQIITYLFWALTWGNTPPQPYEQAYLLANALLYFICIALMTILPGLLNEEVVYAAHLRTQPSVADRQDAQCAREQRPHVAAVPRNGADSQ